MGVRDVPPPKPPLYMKPNQLSKKELISLLPTMDAITFHALCDKSGIMDVWLDVTLTNFNEGYYNVQLPAYGLEISYYDGVFEEVIELEEE
jgi:hypothetical protein